MSVAYNLVFPPTGFLFWGLSNMCEGLPINVSRLNVESFPTVFLPFELVFQLATEGSTIVY